MAIVKDMLKEFDSNVEFVRLDLSSDECEVLKIVLDKILTSLEGKEFCNVNHQRFYDNLTYIENKLEEIGDFYLKSDYERFASEGELFFAVNEKCDLGGGSSSVA